MRVLLCCIPIVWGLSGRPQINVGLEDPDSTILDPGCAGPVWKIPTVQCWSGGSQLYGVLLCCFGGYQLYKTRSVQLAPSKLAEKDAHTAVQLGSSYTVSTLQTGPHTVGILQISIKGSRRVWILQTDIDLKSCRWTPYNWDAA